MSIKKLATLVTLVTLVISISSLWLCSNRLSAEPMQQPMLHSLLVGIGHYNDQKIKSLGDQPSDDVDRMQHFINNNFAGKKNFIVLKDAAATKDAIITAFESLASKVSTGDQVIFYYSGHGDQVPDDDKEPDEKDGKDEVIVNVDALFRGGVLQHIIRDDTLDNLLEKIEAKGVYTRVIMDSCHSGTIAKSIISSSVSAQVNQAYQQRRLERHVVLSPNPLRTIWTAAAAGQVSFGGMQLKNSFYTTLLIEAVEEGLADYNNNKKISNSEVHRYLLDASDKFCSVQSQCKDGLTPTLEIYAAYRGQAFLSLSKAPTKQPISAENTVTLIEESFAQHLSDQIKITLKHQGQHIQHNDELFVALESDVKGHLILLDVNAKGEMVQIFPNAAHPDNDIKPAITYYFPTDAQQSYGFFATEKGKSRLYAIVTQDPIDLTAVLSKDIKPTAIDKPVDYIGRLTQELNAPWTDETITRLRRYRVAAVDYTVH